MVGHVDFKFVLNSNITNIPQIQVTLLKNKAPGLGKVNGKKELEESFTVFFFLKVSVLSEVCWKTWLKLCKYFHFLLISFLFCFSGSCSLFFHLTCQKVSWESNSFGILILYKQKVHGSERLNQILILCCSNPVVIKQQQQKNCCQQLYSYWTSAVETIYMSFHL